MRNAKLVAAFGIVVSTAFFFQNCGKQESYKTTSSDQVIGATSTFSKITKDECMQIRASNPAACSDSILTLDLATGQMSLQSSAGVVKSCVIDAAVLARIDELLANGRLCTPAPLPPGSVTCMALSLPDIKLESSNAAQMLSQRTCNQGVFLCGDSDQKFRDILDQLLSNPPLQCL